MDGKLQELKRAWKTSQSVEDEAAYLRERVRVGDLSQERLELAAYCGHPAALAALPSPLRMKVPEDFGRWGKRLGVYWDQEVSVRAAMAVVDRIPQNLRASGRLVEVIAMAEDWLREAPGRRSAPPDLDGSLFARSPSLAHRDMKTVGVLAHELHRTLTRKAGWGASAENLASSAKLRWPGLPAWEWIKSGLIAYALSTPQARQATQT